MGDYDEPEPGGGQDPSRSGRLLAVGAVVVALALGLAVGFVVGGGTSRESAVASVETTPEPTPTPEPTGPAATATCLNAGTAGAQVLTQLDLAVQAIAALDPTALRQILDRVQPLQRELEGAVAACNPQLDPPR